MLYANVGEHKHTPFPHGKAFCPACGGRVIAKCGHIKTHHWAHEAGQDCDFWAEPIGPWHVSWQSLVRPEFVEVSMGPHRADILGEDGVVVELQHSPIPPDHIEARELFYGNMIWLFDATHRFRVFRSGPRAFFSLGQTKHISSCKKPVLLDFGEILVQVEAFTVVLDKFSGFGLSRDRPWFVSQYLSNALSEDTTADILRTRQSAPHPWDNKCPYALTIHPTDWADPTSGSISRVPAGTPFIPLDYSWPRPGKETSPVWAELIEQHPELANGWARDSLDRMIWFLCGRPMILEGFLRLMPPPANSMSVACKVSSAESHLHEVEDHIHAGRIPVLKEATKRALIEKAKRYEVSKYGHLLGSPGDGSGKQGAQLGLFG